MLLTILNLPYTVTYNDLKSLAYSKCGISDCILDNLTPHENRTKMVTVGLSGEEDAAIFMKKINGTMMNGHKLQVVLKNKNPMSSNLNQGPSFGPQGSSWGPQLNLKSPGIHNQGVPTMVPPPGAMMEPYGGANNIYYPNQHAYYMMNQPAFSTPPSGPNIGYQTLPFGNMGNQGYSQNSWSNYNWNQQQTSDGSQSKKDQAGKWDNGGSKWNNRGSRWDNNESKWDNNVSKWDNNESKWDNNETKWDKNESNWDNNETNWDNNDPNWDNNDSNWGNNPEPERDNIRESRWNSNNSSNWDDYRGPRSNNSIDSKWQSNRNSNRDSYGPNQSAGSSRDQNTSYRRSDQNNSPRSSQNVNRNPMTYSSGNRYNQGDNEPQQNRYKFERQRSPHNRDRYQSPPQNRQRNTKPDFVRGGPADKKGNRIPTESQIKLARMWRGKFVFTKANQILSDPIFEYDAPNPAKLLKALQVEIRKRLNVIITDDYPMRIEQLDKEYKKLYGYKSNWEALRDSLQKTGGQMLSKMETEPVTMQPLFKKIIKTKKNQQQGPKIPQVPQQFGMFGNLKVDHRFEKKGSSAGPSQAHKRKWPGNFEAKGVPLAMIPGRIPQYPWGDKNLYKRQKKDQNEMMAGDLCGRMFDAMKPEMKKAIEDEVEALCAKMLQVCDNHTGDSKVQLFCDSLKTGVPSELKRTLRLNVARRMLPVLPIKIRVHATPVVKRLPLEEFLKDFNVSTLMKSVKQPYYVADVNTIAEHDRLCTMDAVAIGNSVVHFKPFHMFDTQKPKKNVAQTSKESTETSENVGNKGVAKGGQSDNEGGNKNDDQTVDENACYNLIKNESLCKKIKFIHEKINKMNHAIELEEDNEEYHENEEAIEEVYLTGKQFTDNQDFTDDVDVDYVLDSPKGGSKRKLEDAKIQNGSDKKPIAEAIDMTDVHDDDLVDY